MFEERIAAMNQRTEETLAASAGQFDKRTYTVDVYKRQVLPPLMTQVYKTKVKKVVKKNVKISSRFLISHYIHTQNFSQRFISTSINQKAFQIKQKANTQPQALPVFFFTINIPYIAMNVVIISTIPQKEVLNG